MSASGSEPLFAGSIPQVYDSYLVPLIFETYAADLAARVAALRPGRVLELAAGTGVVTRQLAATLPPASLIVASDISQPMLDRAAATIGSDRRIEWRQADALRLPFADASFDVVVCQFGVMFFPDKPQAFAEARRVLAPGGTLIFNVWGRIEENEFAHTVELSLAALFPADPPRFMGQVPHGYYQREAIDRDLVAGGLSSSVEFITLPARSRAATPRIAAVAFCQGTPMHNLIEARGSLTAATDAAAAAIAARFGPGPVDGKMQAHIAILSE